MSAAAVAQRLGLDEIAVGNFSGTGAQFAEFFAVSFTEGAWAVGALATAPAAPTIGAPAIVSPTEVSLAFVAGANGGSPITGYVATSTPPIALTASTPADVTSPVNFTGAFASGVAYTFRLQAVNAVGTGANSGNSTAITPNP